MNDSVLFSPTGPGLHLLAIEQSPLADLMMRWGEKRPMWAVRRIRGEKSVDVARFFDEAAAALQFPYYFGANWNAFWECITDLSWLWRPSFLLIFDRADVLLRDSPGDFATLARVLADANEHWRAQQGDFGGAMIPVSFQTLLACSADALPALAKRLEATGAPFSLL